jgi:hypothetical protein
MAVVNVSEKLFVGLLVVKGFREVEVHESDGGVDVWYGHDDPHVRRPELLEDPVTKVHAKVSRGRRRCDLPCATDGTPPNVEAPAVWSASAMSSWSEFVPRRGMVSVPAR